MAGKRRFGRVRELPSGRWQARYKGPDGIDRPAPNTFESKTSAERWLTLTEAAIIQGDWLDPDAGAALFKEYATLWVAERPNLRPKTVQLYEGLVGLHLVPVLGMFAVVDIREATVRRWRKFLLDSGVGVVTVAKALIFTGPKGAQLRRSNFSRAWNKATTAAGLASFHFHDLRHTGNTLGGEAGATLRELMDRMGHASTRAALIYQHRTTQRDMIIADEISRRAEAELERSGTQRARGKGTRS